MGRKLQAQRQSSHQPVSPAICMSLTISPFERWRVYWFLCSLTHVMADRRVTLQHPSLTAHLQWTHSPRWRCIMPSSPGLQFCWPLQPPPMPLPTNTSNISPPQYWAPASFSSLWDWGWLQNKHCQFPGIIHQCYQRQLRALRAVGMVGMSDHRLKSYIHIDCAVSTKGVPLSKLFDFVHRTSQWWWHNAGPMCDFTQQAVVQLEKKRRGRVRMSSLFHTWRLVLCKQRKSIW